MFESFQTVAAPGPATTADDVGFVEACGANWEKMSTPACKAFINAQTTQLAAEATGRKQATFAKTITDLQRSLDMGMNSQLYTTRNADLNNTTQYLESIAKKRVEDSKYDVDISRRQFEINEYAYYNKLDTLFFLQLLFISVMVMTVIVYFSRKGAISMATSGILTLLLGLVVVIVGISRYFYTDRTRDRRLWHRRYFDTEKEPVTSATTCPGAPSGAPSTAAIDLTATIDLSRFTDSRPIKCIKDTASNYQSWLDTTANEISKNISTTSIFGDLKAADSCKA